LTLRRSLALVHRYSGLLLLVFVLISASTGSLLVFSHEIDRWLNTGLLRVAVPADGRSRPYAEQLAAAVASQADEPEAWQPVSLIPGRHVDGATGVLFRHPDPTRTDGFFWRQVLVDPYTARVLGQRERTRLSADRPGLMNLISEVHGKLLLGDAGRRCFGIVAIVWLLSLPLGLFLWWPGRGKLRLGLTVRRDLGPARRNFDLHRVAGFYSAPVIAAVTLSGIYMAWPGEVRQLVGTVLAVDGNVAPKMPLADGPAQIDADAALRVARNVFADGELRRIGLPRRPGDAYAVSIRLPGEVRRPSTARSTVWVDSRDGRPLKVYDAARAAAGDTYLDWQTPLHTGSAFGLPGRIAVALGGLAAVLGCISGFLVWRRRSAAGRRPASEFFSRTRKAPR